MIVVPADPRDPQATALLKQSHALLQSLFPPEENYFLDIDDLCQPDIRFFVARDGADAVGTAALALKDGYGEVKSMFIDPEKRGQGIANDLLSTLEETALGEGITVLRLETSSILAAAVKLYKRHGFSECEIFGDYEQNATSLYMEKVLLAST